MAGSPRGGEPVRTQGEGPATRPGPQAGATTPERRPLGESEAAQREEARVGRRHRAIRHTRNAGAATAGAVGSGIVMLARLVLTVAVLIALLIGLAIVLRDVDANAGNSIVKGIHEGANFFAGAFTGLITFAGHPKRELTVNWGIALIVFLIVGVVISRIIAGVGRTGLRFEERHRAVPTH
jgi:hypothetical protein